MTIYKTPVQTPLISSQGEDVPADICSQHEINRVTHLDPRRMSNFDREARIILFYGTPILQLNIILVA